MGKEAGKMKILVLIISAVLIFTCAVFAEELANSETELALKDAIIVASRNNKDIQLQEKEVEVAKADIRGAASAFLPNLEMNGSYTHYDELPQPENIFTGYQDDYKAGITLNESIYNGGANIASLRQAQLGLNVAQETLRARKLDVEFEVKRLYYGLALAYETERIAQELLNQAQSHYEDVQKKFTEGTASRFGVLQSKVQVSKVTPELVRAKNAVNLIEAELKKVLGVKMQENIKLKERIEYVPVEIREDEFLKQAYLNKPEMILKSLGIDIGEWAIAYAKSSNRPQVNFQANYGYRSNDIDDMINQRNSNWNAGLAVSLPIFDGFASKAKVDAARARYAEASIDKENLSDQIAVDVKNSCLDLNQAKVIIDVSGDSIEEAKEALRLAQINYDNGEGTNLEILDAQVSLSQIEQNYSSATYDYLMAKASLDRTMGEGFLEEGDNEKK